MPAIADLLVTFSTDVCCVTTSVDLAMPVPVSSSACWYRCQFNRVQERTITYCADGEPIDSSSECITYTCNVQPDDDERTKLRRKRRQVTIGDGVRCRCRCLDFSCNCKNSTETGCQELPTWICSPGSAAFPGTHFVSTCECMCDQPT